ncbi:MAG: hypothetical protein ACK55Z_35495 [bacterium]
MCSLTTQVMLYVGLRQSRRPSGRVRGRGCCINEIVKRLLNLDYDPVTER